MDIGVNTYGLRHDLAADFDGTMERLKAIGVTEVEVCLNMPSLVKAATERMTAEMAAWAEANHMGFAFWSADKAGERISRVRAHGLKVVKAHLAIPAETGEAAWKSFLAEAVDFAAANDITAYVMSPMKKLDGIAPYLPMLNLAAETLGKAGITACVHNHAMECIAQDGKTALEAILTSCPDIMMEPDLGWMMAGGMDPVPFLKTCGDRIYAIHLKDIKAGMFEIETEERFTAIGEGALALKEIMETIVAEDLTGKGVIIDQDASMGDFVEDIGIGYKNITAAMA